MKRRILLVDDDPILSALLREYLENAGYAVAQAFDGAQFLSLVDAPGFDMIIVDVMMPKLSGLEALRIFRRSHDTPLIMLTALGDTVERIIGLEMGADDYLPKPCEPRELLARIKAVWRRADGGDARNATATVGRLRLDPTTRLAHAGEVALTLTAAEFEVLASLLRRHGQVVDKAALSAQALGKKLGPHDRSLDMHISHLRKKLRAAGSDVVIKTVRSRGFMLCVGSSEGEVPSESEQNPIEHA